VRVPWTAFITERNKHMCSNEALDLLNKMLVYDKNLRINCVDAMKHTYFDPVREFVQEQDEAKLEQANKDLGETSASDKAMDS